MEFINLLEKLLEMVAISIWVFAVVINGAFDPNKAIKK